MNEELTETELRTIMESSFAPLFDPVKAYLDSCPEWDGHDHLADFADSIVVNDPERFRNILKMWFVGLIMSYQNDQIVNHIMIVLFTGSQGVGKTAALHRFFPPELRAHMFTPKACQIKKEEFASYVAHKLCIIVDELQKLDDEALDSLESDITIPKVDFRMPYAHYSSSRWHIASFLGASNNTSFMKGNHGNRRFHVFEVYKFNEFEPNYQQIFAQVRHLIETNFKYYFTAQEQDELAAYAYNFEDNTLQYEMVHKYVRIYPEEWKDKQTHKVGEIVQAMHFFNSEIVNNKSTIALFTNALRRKKFHPVQVANQSAYECYILTAEQVGYIEKHRNPNVVLDVRMDKEAPIEILIAHRDAKIEDIEMAAQFYQQTKDIEKAKEMYAVYMKNEFGNMFTNDMPF
jgi:predicted P-loop ATPase